MELLHCLRRRNLKCGVPMIKRAAFKNFKALRDVEVTFDSRLTVLVGPNGSGKTSVLQGIEIVGRFANGQIPQQFGTQSIYGQEIVFGWPGDSQLAIEKNILDDATIEIVCNSKGSRDVRCLLTRNRDTRREQDYNFSCTIDQGRDSGALPELEAIRSTALLRLDPDVLRRASIKRTALPIMRFDGYMLASVLDIIRGKYPDKYNDIVKSLKSVISGIDNLRADFLDYNGQISDTILFDMKGFKGEWH